MIKPLELIKVLVSSVCTVPNKRNTRRSTALGETPYLVLCQITRTIQSHEFWMGVAVACREEVCMPVCSVTHQYLRARLNGCSFLLAEFFFPNSFGWGTGGLVRIHVLEKGVRFKKFQSLMLQSVESKKIKIKKNPKRRERNQLVWTSSGDGRKVLSVYCTMYLSCEGGIMFILTQILYNWKINH